MKLRFLERVLILVALWGFSTTAMAGTPGSVTRDHVLLGMHFLHARTAYSPKAGSPVEIAGFWDYVEHMPEDLKHISYADFWHWWSEFERYKGDEKGFTEFDRVVDACLARGMKVKVDVAWSTWWTLDKDWEQDGSTIHGAHDLDDWIHLCDTLGRRYRGRVALWLLQGEANDLKTYWQGASIEHVSEAYRLGSRALKRADPATRVSIAGASPSVSRDDLDRWVKVHATACKGDFDDIPMNYFGDVADPYGGMDHYRRSIRKTLDDLGLQQVEVGSGESSFQWAESSEKLPQKPPTSIRGFVAEKAPLCEFKQAWRLNESLGDFFDSGENKFMLWGSEFAPGRGWPWRWGFRKFQDWWGSWPETCKVPGTNIVFGNDVKGTKIDLRPGWTSAPTDPYHPIWQVYKFWAQMCPPGSEAVRLPASIAASGPRLFRAATYLQAEDRCVAPVQNDEKTQASLSIDLARTGWPDGAAIDVLVKNQSIDYATGKVTERRARRLPTEKQKGTARFALPEIEGFTTIEIGLASPEYAAAFEEQTTRASEAGVPHWSKLVIKNIGRSTWTAGRVAIVCCDGPFVRESILGTLTKDIKPGERLVTVVNFPAAQTAGHAAYACRLREEHSGWFGPRWTVSFNVSDRSAPRRLCAFRELGHVRLKWFPPERPEAVIGYEIYRADGFDRPFARIASVHGTDYRDDVPKKDQAYYYHVVAIDRAGNKGRPSNDDNAKALTKPRFWDSEIVEHNLPARIQARQTHPATVMIRNTGSKAWDLTRPGAEFSLSLKAMQRWGCQDEARLPAFALKKTVVKPGDTVQVSFPYSGLNPGRFENHWVLSIDLAGKERIYFGTPLLVETLVAAP
jgi:hypothetical protein